VNHYDPSAPAERRMMGFAFDRPPATPSSPIWWISATVLALLLRLWGLTQQALWTDEVESLKLVVQPGADPLYVITHNFHGPLHKALLWGWVSLLGVGDYTARLLSVVIGTLTVPLTFVTARRWLGENAARAAAFLLAINPFHIWYSQEVRGYVLLIAFGVLGVAAMLAEVRGRSLRSALALYGTSLGACLSSFGGFFLIATSGLMALVAGWRRGYPVRRFVVVHLLVVASLATYLGEFGSTVDPDAIVGIGEVEEEDLLRGSHTFSPLAPLHSLFAYSVGLTVGPSINEMHRSLAFETFRPHLIPIALSAIVFGLSALVGVRRACRRPELCGVLVLWVAVPIAATALLALVNLKVYNVRYPSVGFVPWVLLVAMGLVSLRGRILRVGAWAAVLGLTALSLHGLHGDPRYARPDARAAAELILREGRPGDRILNYTVVEPFRYYYAWLGGGDLEIHHLLGWHFRRGRFDPYMEELASCEGRLWVVRHRGWYVDPRGKTKAALDANLEHLGAWRFTDLPVDLYACTGAPSRADEDVEAPAGAGDSTRSAASR
jgi:hypothetical protein